MGGEWNTFHARAEVGHSEMQRRARARLKNESFWLGQPREGWTATCAEIATLMSAGPRGGYRPMFDMACASPDIPTSRRKWTTDGRGYVSLESAL